MKLAKAQNESVKVHMYKLIILDKKLSETEVIRIVENIREIVSRVDVEMPYIHVHGESDAEP